MKKERLSYSANAYHPSLGSETAAGLITFTQFTLRFESDLARLDIPLNELTIRVGQGDDARLYFDRVNDPEWSLYTLDFDILKDYAFSSNHHLRVQANEIFGRKYLRKTIIITAAFILFFFLAAFCVSWGMGQMVRHVVNRMPPDVEKSLGATALKEVQKRFAVVDDPKLMARLETLYARLRQGMPDTNVTVQFHILDTDIPNAMSIPGHVFFTRGMFDLLNTPEEIAGTLAHEMGHINEKHILRSIIADQGPARVLSSIFGKQSGTIGMVVLSSQFLVGRTFSKDFEHEADEDAWKYLVKAHINPRGLIETMEKLKEYEDRNHVNTSSILSTHPSTQDRIDRLESNWRSLKQKTGFVELTDY
ncbi:M48 family metallopeptidase [Pedosphaera parvula]|uniref:M48 family metallopeptidase n=1 Tax=Pedosphaera parvula TaxID=1032527 RepID=UPI00031B074D|nr:M48 family metallopeptidase [Pedosphaera parvula]